MKRVFILSCIILFLLLSNSSYGALFGPAEPKADPEKNKFAFDAGYFYQTANMEPSSSAWDNQKIQQNNAYLQVSFAPVKYFEMYLRGGAADFKAPDAFNLGTTTVNFGDNPKMFGTAGIKYFLYNSQNFGFAPFLQGSYYSTYKDNIGFVSAGTTYSTEVKFKNPWDINVGFILQAKLQKITFYGGPFAYWFKTKVENSTSPALAGSANANSSTTYEEQNNIGGFLGVRIPITGNISFDVEGQYKSRFSIGGSASYRF
jgi:hypothetical protein